MGSVGERKQDQHLSRLPRNAKHKTHEGVPGPGADSAPMNEHGVVWIRKSSNGMPPLAKPSWQELVLPGNPAR